MREPRPFQLIDRLELTVVEAALAEVKRLPDWGSGSKALSDPRRKSAVIRGNNRYPKTGICHADMIDTCYNTSNYQHAVVCMQIVDHVRQATGWNEKLGMITVSSMGPGGIITPHIDGGEYFNFYHRIQIPLSAGTGIIFSCEAETLEMKPGEIWCLDNKRVHWVENRSSSCERINLFFDTR